MDPTFFVQTMRTFVTRLVGVYHETLAHICIIVRPYLMFTPIVCTARVNDLPRSFYNFDLTLI